MINATVRKVGNLFKANSVDLVEQETAKALSRAGRVLESAIKSDAPVASGRMKGGVRTLASRSGLAVRVVSELGQEFYSIPVQSGTKQGKVAIEPLVRWVELTTGKSGVKALQMAFAVATVKARKGGIDKTNWFYGPWDRLRPRINAQYLAPVGAAVVEELDS